MHDPDLYVRAHRVQPRRVPLMEVLSKHRRPLLVCTAITASGTIPVYLLNVYMPVYASQYLGLTLKDCFIAQAISGLLLLGVTPLMGGLSDGIGRKRVLVGSFFFFLITVYPVFAWLIDKPTPIKLGLALLALGFWRCGASSVMSAVFAEQFPTMVRSTGMSVAYNVAVMCFGGSAQVIATWLIHATGAPISMAYYIMLASVVGVIAACFIKQPVVLETAIDEKPAREREFQLVR